MNSPKVTGLNGFGLEVPDVEVAEKFYTTFGLAAERRGEALHLRSPGRSNDEAIIVRGPAKRMHHLSFVIERGSESAFADKLHSSGLTVSESAPAGGMRGGLWFQDPWGTWINLSPREIESIEPTVLPTYNLGGRGERIDVNLWETVRTQQRPPLRIGHMLVFTPELEKAEAFYADVLGMRAADRATGKVTFMAAGEGVVDHHCFGFVASTHRGFQHASFQVASLDDIGFGVSRMAKAGYRESFGLGRHALASNLFHYIRDPWGSWVEYYADMDKISPQWVCRNWNELPYIWGPEWSPEFWGKEMNGNFEGRE